MSATHNLDYYYSLYNKFIMYNETAQEHKKVNYFLNPPLYVASNCAHLLNSQISSAALKNTYLTAGAWATKITGVFSTSLSKTVDAYWHDPIETRTLLKIGLWVQNTFKPWTKRTASTRPLLGRIDRGFIAFSRHVYILSKDLNTILSLPDKVRSFIEGTQPMETATPTLLSRTWSWIKKGTNAVKDSFTKMVLWIIRQIAIVLKKVPYLEPYIIYLEGKVENGKSYLEGLFEQGKAYLHEKVVKKAQDVISRKETALRKKAVGAVAEILARKAISFFTTFTITTALGFMIYKIPDIIGTNTTDHSKTLSTIRKVVGTLLWAKSVTPIFYGLQDDYREDFNPEASTLRELRTLINTQNLHKVIKLLKSL